MTIGNVVDLMDDGKKVLIIQEGESQNIEGSFTDGDGNPIVKSAIATFTLDLYDEETDERINSRGPTQNIMDLNGGTVDTNGNFELRLDPADAVIVSSTLADRGIEKHLVKLIWTWDDGVKTRTGIQIIRIRVQKTATITTP